MNQQFQAKIIAQYGDIGQQWLDNLPDVMQEFALEWNLTNLKPCENLSYNYVASGTQNNQPIILKLGIDLQAIENEANALLAFAGHGMINLYDEDLDCGALLLERATPGHTLKTLFPHDDVHALNTACQTIELMHQAEIPKKHNFPLLTEWLNILEKDWDIDATYLQQAREFKKQLLQKSNKKVLLHGDLHYDNILANGDTWLAIDPKGVIGDPIFDKIGCLIREPLSELLEQNNAPELIIRRIDQIANYFNLDTKLIIEWTYMHTVMAICWCLEDKQEPANMYKFLTIISRLMAA